MKETFHYYVLTRLHRQEEFEDHSEVGLTLCVWNNSTDRTMIVRLGNSGGSRKPSIEELHGDKAHG